jgi:hypothetical protein
MKYCLSFINLNLFCSSIINNYKFLNLKLKQNKGLLLFEEINDNLIDFLKYQIGIYHFNIYDNLIIFPFFKIDSGYYNYIPENIEDGFNFRNFNFNEILLYQENPYLKMYHDDNLIHINTLQDNNFIISKNISNYCCLCNKKKLIIQFRDCLNDLDTLQICFTCLEKFFF